MANYVRYFDTVEGLMDFIEVQERAGITVICDKEKKRASLSGIDEQLAQVLLMDEDEENVCDGPL